MVSDQEIETSARRITPVRETATVAPGAELLFEVGVPESVAGRAGTRWTVDGREATDVGPLHDEYLHNGMDFLRRTFESPGEHEVTAVVVDEAGAAVDTVAWTVTVADGGSRAPVLERPTAVQEVTYADDTDAVDLTILVRDDDADLHRTVWFLRGGDVYLGSTSVQGDRDTASLSVSTFCDYCRVFVLLVDENGAVRSTAPYYFHRVADASPEAIGVDQTLVVRSDDGDRVFYEFEVSGTLAYGAAGDEPAHPEFIEGARARGSVEGTSEDVFTFTGELTDFRTEGPAVVTVDDDRVDLSVFDDGRLDLSVFDADLRPDSAAGTDSEVHDLVVESTGDERAEYALAVSGDLEYGDDERTDPFPRDRDGATANGAVADGERDRYQFTGEVIECSVVGPATVHIDGKVVTSAAASARQSDDGAAATIQFVESDVSVERGADIELQGLVRNEGDAAGERRVWTSLTGPDVLQLRRDLVVDLDPDELQFVDLEPYGTAALPPGEYTFSATTGDDTASTPVTVESD
ncbi:hypothetical protein ACFQGE_02870 [Halomicroarcula sp. GCM10025817]|uniref:hypothetical protein n=1 Tax=Halomicroarcula sp. GCM10025817 TaxID=3252672 RepID=UPI00360CCB81